MIRGTIQYTRDPAMRAREFKTHLKAELEAVGSYWWQQILPSHFSLEAQSKYSYQARAKNYMINKAKRQHHQRPLVFSGELQHTVTRQARISATSKAARVVLMGPRYLYAYRKNYKQPDKAKELTATIDSEVMDMARLLDQRLTQRINTGRATN